MQQPGKPPCRVAEMASVFLTGTSLPRDKDLEEPRKPQWHNGGVPNACFYYFLFSFRFVCFDFLCMGILPART